MNKQPEYKIAIVVPVHIQPTKEWVRTLFNVAKNHTVIIVDDSNGIVKLPLNWDVYDYERQREELGDELYAEFEQFHKSSACRNFGHWIAYQQGYDIIIGLDSDCNVPPNFVSDHLKALMSESYGWVNPIRQTNWFPRGFPYFERNRKTILNIGLWDNELDINGKDRVAGGQPPKDLGVVKQDIAHGMIPLCGMNFAMWSYAIPGFLFLPNFDDGHEKFRRYDDIWGGYIFQKLMQKTREMITYGNPIVYHDTIVDAAADAELETAGIRWEKEFYQFVDIVCKDIEKKGYVGMFADFADKSDIFLDTPFKNVISGIKFWKKLYEPKETND